MSSIFSLDPSKTRFFSNQNKGPHLGSRYEYDVIHDRITWFQLGDLPKHPLITLNFVQVAAHVWWKALEAHDVNF